MADPVIDPAPSPSTPAVDPAAPAPAVADPNTPPVTAPVAADPAKAAEPVASVIPEKYDFAAVKLPDGVTLDTAMLTALDSTFKEAGLTQDNASKIVEAHANAIVKIEAQKETEFKAWMATTVKGYQDQLKSDWGASHDANLAIAQRGMARFCTPEMKQILDDTGLGSNPVFVKAFHEIGKMVSEDKPPNTGMPNGRKSNEAVFYGSPN